MKKRAYYGIFTILFFILSACDPDTNEVPKQWAAEFLSRPVSGQINILRENNVKISNLSFRDMPDKVAIKIELCDNVEITECDFSNVRGGIYLLSCNNVTITWNRFSNIGDLSNIDPSAWEGGYADYIQLDKTFDGYIAHNKGKGGDTEDLISIYMSGGSSQSSPLIIEYNHFEGGNWKSGSGSGIMTGDFGGQYTIVRYNKLLSPGQAGIGISSGIGISVIGNTIYGEKMPRSNVGVYVWNQFDTPIGDIEISGNKVRWYSEDGSEGPYWNGERTNGRDIPIKGEENNNWNSDLDPEKLRVKL